MNARRDARLVREDEAFGRGLERGDSGSGGITLGGLWSGTLRLLDGTVTYRPSYNFCVSLQMQRTAAKHLDSLIQYDAARRLFNANIRFNFTYRPLSDIFVVYNEQRFATPENPVPAGRGLIVKFTRMFAF